MPAPDQSYNQYPPGSVMNMLLPFLQTGDSSLLNPMGWLDSYGMYLNPYDRTPDATAMEELAMQQSESKKEALSNIDEIQAGIAMSGFGGSYIGDRVQGIRDKFALELQANYSNALYDQRAAQQAWEGQTYSDLAQLAAMEAFNPNALSSSDFDGIGLMTGAIQNHIWEQMGCNDNPNQPQCQQWSEQYGGDEFIPELTGSVADAWLSGDLTNPWQNTGTVEQEDSCLCADGSYSPACCGDINTETAFSPHSWQGNPDTGEIDWSQFYSNNDPFNTGAVDYPNQGNSFDALFETDTIWASDQSFIQSGYNDCISNATTTEEMQSCYNNAANAYQTNMNDAEQWFESLDWDGDTYGSDLWGGAFPVAELCDQNSPVHDYNACMEFHQQQAGEDENTTGDEDTGDNAGTGTEFGDDPDWGGEGGISP